MRATHTFVTMDLSEAAFNEIRQKLQDAGYEHAFIEEGLIDMRGIAVQRGE